MNRLKQDAILQRIPELQLQIDSSNYVEVWHEGKAINCGIYGLKVLDAFSRPNSIANVMAMLKPQFTGMQDWMDVTATIMQLYEAGILQDETQKKPILRTQTYGFDAANIHINMLNDRTRTQGYFDAIQAVVRPGDVVVEIGTGTGVLAIAAAKAGAKHVYAIEASSIGELAEANFVANGLADRITLLKGWSTQVTLPEPADVLISEIIGNDPLHEQVLEFTHDAIKRFLKPDARLLPAKLKVYALPVSIPETSLAKRTFTAKDIKVWQDWYDIDFSALLTAAQRSTQTFLAKPFYIKDWQTLSDPIRLVDVDLRDIKSLSINKTVPAIANTSGQLNGIVIYFELELSTHTVLSTHPAIADKDCNWRIPVWLIDTELALQTGEPFNIIYRYRVGGRGANVSVSRSPVEARI